MAVRATLLLLTGAVLGVLSRIEGVTPGLSAGVSSDSTWVAAAFVAGAVAPGVGSAAVAATLLVTTANGAYYGWIAATEPHTPLASAAGSPVAWLVLGVASGLVFGPAGRLWRAGPGPVRAVASLPLAAVLVLEGADVLTGAPAAEGIGLLAGILLPPASARTARTRVAALAAVVVLVGLGAAGAGRLLP